MIKCLHCRIDIDGRAEHKHGCPLRPISMNEEKCSVDQDCRLLLECDRKNVIAELEAELEKYGDQIILVIYHLCINCDECEECASACDTLLSVAKIIPALKDRIIKSCTPLNQRKR